MDSDIKGFAEKMDHAVDHFRKEIQSLRTGRPSLSLIEHIRVEYYGNPVSLDKVAALNIVDNRMITITPWEPKLIGDIEKAIMAANLGFTPQNDGKCVRIVVPPMTEDRRKQMVKLLKKMAEEAKVVLRNIRRDANEDLKKKNKEGLFQEDRLKRLQEEVQKLVDGAGGKVDEHARKKEQEILTT
jgi:ribosome recycling factor